MQRGSSYGREERISALFIFISNVCCTYKSTPVVTYHKLTLAGETKDSHILKFEWVQQIFLNDYSVLIIIWHFTDLTSLADSHIYHHASPLLRRHDPATVSSWGLIENKSSTVKKKKTCLQTRNVHEWMKRVDDSRTLMADPSYYAAGKREHVINEQCKSYLSEIYSPYPINVGPASCEPQWDRDPRDRPSSICMRGEEPDAAHTRSPSDSRRHRASPSIGRRRMASGTGSCWPAWCWRRKPCNPPSGTSSGRSWLASQPPGARRLPGRSARRSPTTRRPSNFSTCHSRWTVAWCPRSRVSRARRGAGGPGPGWRSGRWAPPRRGGGGRPAARLGALPGARTGSRTHHTEK